MNTTAAKDHEDRYQHSLSFYREGDHDRCRETLEQLLRSDPRHVAGLTLKGMILLESEDPPGAIAALSEATRLDPSSAEAWSHLGVALMTEGQLQPAVDAFRAALQVQPEDVDVLTDMANLLFTLGRVDEALETLQTAGRLRPKSLSIARNMAEMMVAAGRLDQALRTVQAMLELSPGDLVTHSDVAWLNYQLGQLDEAWESFHNLKQLGQETDHLLYALHGLAMIEIKRQDWRRALDWAIEATRLDRYEFATLLLRFVSSRLFDPESEVREEELDERFATEHHEHRRLCAEVPT